MHLGNIFAALISYLSAKSRGGEWILRIEDLDRGRCREEYVTCLQRDLEALGLYWDNDPGSDVSDGYRQSRRDAIYAEYLDKIKDLTYPCWCTRAERQASNAPHESDGRLVYSGLCRNNPERAKQNRGKPAATRIVVPDRDITFIDGHYGPQSVNLAGHCGDFVLRRSDGSWAYQFAVVVDDALMGVTEVVRGRDLLLSAAQQIYLFDALGFERPAYSHFPLLCAQDGRRLSKRDAGMELGELLKTLSPEAVIGRLARLAGLSDNGEPCRPEDLIPLFDWKKLPTEDIIIKEQ